jgi:hypothetical protein
MFMPAEGRNPKAEGRKKAEFRRPNRLPADPGLRRFQKQKLKGQRTLGRLRPVAWWKRVLSAFGIRPSFGLRASGFGFGGLIPPKPQMDWSLS